MTFVMPDNDDVHYIPVAGIVYSNYISIEMKMGEEFVR